MIHIPHTIQSFTTPDWGAYYKPLVNDEPENDDSLRVVLFGSTLGGMWVLEALQQLKACYGDKLKLIGLATDEARSSSARISVKKRIWHYFEQDVRDRMVNQIISKGLSSGMEVFTGNIKSAFFDQLIKKWNPDLIIMACFGQIVPPSIFGYPKMGMYNFHPSDLKNNIGAGPKPFEETLEHRMSHTCVSLMGVTEIIDHGPLIGQSPPVRITGTNNETFDEVLLTEEKVTSVFPDMTAILVNKILSLHAIPSNGLKIDFNIEIDESVKTRLKQPLSGVHGLTYPFPDPATFIMDTKTLIQA